LAEDGASVHAEMLVDLFREVDAGIPTLIKTWNSGDRRRGIYAFRSLHWVIERAKRD
jgi:hypothetical protein